MLDLKKVLIPKPQSLTAYGATVKIAQFHTPNFTLEVIGEDERIAAGAALIRARLCELAAVDGEGGDYTIRLFADEGCEKFKGVDKGEAYFVEVGEDQATLCGKDAAGAFYAAVTFSQMLYTEGEDVLVERAEILDFPDFARRGHFIESRYGTEFLTRQNWFDFIDYLANMKINTLTVGVYGCWGRQYDGERVEYLYVPIQKHPELITPKSIKYYSVKKGKWVHREQILPTMYAEDLLGDIIAWGKRKNVLVKPLFNSLGHNTLLPRMIPEISAKREDGTPSDAGFCTSSERTYEVMLGIYDEIIDRYLLPNGVYDIHIGLDEVHKDAVCHCAICAGRERPALMVDYIVRICKHLKARGMRHIYIYHDMLYHHFNVVNEALRERFIAEGIYDEVVLDWWSYEDPAHLFWDKADGVNSLFHSVIKPDTGYFHWSIPTENNENIRACAKMAKTLGFEGMESYSSLAYCYDKNYLTLADVAWNHAGIEDMAEFDARYAYRYDPDGTGGAIEAFRALFDIMRDETGKTYMNRLCQKFDYYFYGYRTKDGGLKDFPGGVYRMIREDEQTYLSYLEYIKERAARALHFFRDCGKVGQQARIWLLTAKQYACMADEYLTLYGLDREYNAGKADAAPVMRELERLIAQREELMALAEEVRLPANSYTYLRNMSVFRQCLLDLLRYFKREVSEGRRPRLDVTDWSQVQGRALAFLR